MKGFDPLRGPGSDATLVSVSRLPRLLFVSVAIRGCCHWQIGAWTGQCSGWRQRSCLGAIVSPKSTQPDAECLVSHRAEGSETRTSCARQSLFLRLSTAKAPNGSGSRQFELHAPTRKDGRQPTSNTMEMYNGGKKNDGEMEDGTLSSRS